VNCALPSYEQARHVLCKSRRSEWITCNKKINNGGIMKKVIISIACCAMIAPLAFAQSSKQKTSTAAEKGVTVTGTIVTTTVEGGAAASYQPAKTLVVLEDASKDPGRYVLSGPGHIVNQKGEIIPTPIKPGTHVRVYFAGTGATRAIDHVVVD
jgi:hypothetical protein